MIPVSDSIQIVEYELDGARAWGGRHQVPIEWSEGALELRVTFTQPTTGELFYLTGAFNNYKEIPPDLTFRNAAWQNPHTKENFPNPVGATPFGPPIFIQHNGVPVICAPFNRRAYAQNAGPHSDWGDPAQWETAAPRQVHAVTIGDMLQVIFRDLAYTKGRMG